MERTRLTVVSWTLVCPTWCIVIYFIYRSPFILFVCQSCGWVSLDNLCARIGIILFDVSSITVTYENIPWWNIRNNFLCCRFVILLMWFIRNCQCISGPGHNKQRDKNPISCTCNKIFFSKLQHCAELCVTFHCSLLGLLQKIFSHENTK